MRAKDVLSTIDKRINATKDAINFDYSTSKLQMGRPRELKLDPQRHFIFANPTIMICVEGSGNRDRESMIRSFWRLG